VAHRKGAAKQRKAKRVRNKGANRVRGRQSGGGGKESSLTARPIGRTLGVALAGKAAPGERGSWEWGSAKTTGRAEEVTAPAISGPAEAADVNPSQEV
jgi:hypothetical protein